MGLSQENFGGFLKYGLFVSAKWVEYYAASPFRNFLQVPSDHHPAFKIHAVSADTFTEEFMEAVQSYKGIVVDEVFATHFSFFKGPKLLIDGDPHRNRYEDLKAQRERYNSVDYILTCAMPGHQVLGRYYLSPQERDFKFLYFPHFVAEPFPFTPVPWEQRDPRALLIGSRDPLVYPFRSRTDDLSGKETLAVARVLAPVDYLALLKKHKSAYTCHSIFNYTVSKYFEIPWTGAVCIGQTPSYDHLDLLGFVSGENCAFVDNPEQAVMAARIIGNDAGHWEHIALKGKELVESRHTAWCRMNYLEKVLDRMDAGTFNLKDQYDIFASAHHKESA